MFYSYIVLLIYVNETIYLLQNLPFFMIHVSCFMAWDDSRFANDLKMHIVGEGPGATLSFETFLSLISSQLVAI